MKSILSPGIIAGLSLVCALSAMGQTSSAAPASNSAPLATPAHRTPTNNQYEYDFISKGYVWSNKPLKSTASKICKTMRDPTFSETPYGISGNQDWNSCLDMQIRSIGYMRWLRNNGFKANAKNRKMAKNYLEKTYSTPPWGGYTFAQLSEAVKATQASHR